jgi:hypothetical protein
MREIVELTESLLPPDIEDILLDRLIRPESQEP